MNNHYRVLGLQPNASPRKIREQYRRLAKRYHPDAQSNPADKARYAEKFKAITEAYNALSSVARQANLEPQERKLNFLYQQGKSLLDQKKWAKAMIVFNEIVSIDSTYRDTLSCLQEARRRQRLKRGVEAGPVTVYEIRKTQGGFFLSLSEWLRPERGEFPALLRQLGEFPTRERFGQ